jgi:hypothetical protein
MVCMVKLLGGSIALRELLQPQKVELCKQTQCFVKSDYSHLRPDMKIPADCCFPIMEKMRASSHVRKLTFFRLTNMLASESTDGEFFPEENRSQLRSDLLSPVGMMMD